MKKITIKRKYLAFPYAVFMLLFVILPLALIVFYAFTNADGSISLENFANFFTDGVAFNSFLDSIWIAFVTTLICFVVGFPVAYILANKKYNKNKTLFMLFLLPMWINFLLRTIATRAMFEAFGSWFNQEITFGKATTIFGMDKVLGGKVLLKGQDITGQKTRQVIAAGLNYVPEDRHLNGLFKICDVSANTTSASLFGGTLGKFLLDRRQEYDITERYVQNFRTKVTGHDQLTGSLSGGNQQKIVIGRSLATEPGIVILDEPTRGIDAAARGDVYSIIHQLREQGVSVLLISSDMEEIVELADRAVTMYQGRINAEFQKEEINQDNLMAAAFGIVGEGAKEA